jgi:RNA polymerase-binding transcription factor DksA
MKHLESKFVAEIKKLLLQQQAELLGQVDDSSRQGTTSDDDPNTRFPQYGFSQDDNAMEVSNYQDNISVQHGLNEELSQIKLALLKIDQGAYGICSNCGQDIPKERLSVFPAATLCVNCSKVKE